MTHRTVPDRHRQPDRAKFWLIGLAAVLTALVGSTPALAEKTTYGETIEVEEVLLDVVVTDESGEIVRDLDRDDFVIREEDTPVDVNAVTFVGPTAEAEDPRRYFILFFHQQRVLLPRLAANLIDAGRRAQQWVSSLGPNDYVAVVSYFPKYRLLDFTNDTDTLVTAIGEAARGEALSISPSDLPKADVPSLAENLPPGDVDRIYEALAMTAEAAGAIEGRKNLVLFSIGFGEPDGFGFYRPDLRYYPETIQALNDNHVAVYPVDLLATDLAPSLRIHRFEHVLSRLAIETGGQFFFNFVNYLSPLERVAEDNQGYYLLSFTPAGDPNRGTYREVDVDVRGTDLDIRARDGYVVGDTYPYDGR